MKLLARLRRIPWWSWFWYGLGALYFLVPLYATLDFSLRMERGIIGFKAYERAFADPNFLRTFLYSNVIAVITIVCNVLLIVPTVYWIRLRLPQARWLAEYTAQFPNVIVGIILVFGLISVFGSPVRLPFTEVVVFPALTNSDLGTNILYVAACMVLTLPFMFRSVDTGMRSVDVITLTEAAQSLGASWAVIILRIVLPNLRAALLSGALLTFAVVVGEVTIASFLGRPAFAPYLWLLGQHRAYEPAALTVVSFMLTWVAMVSIQFATGGQSQATGAH